MVHSLVRSCGNGTRRFYSHRIAALQLHVVAGPVAARVEVLTACEFEGQSGVLGNVSDSASMDETVVSNELDRTTPAAGEPTRRS